MLHHQVIVIGAGQAGLATSYCLAQRGIAHVVVEQGRIAERWRSARWDSFRLVTSNASCRLPGWSYDGPDPYLFMARDEFVRFLLGYAASFGAPVREGVTVQRVVQLGNRFRVETSEGALTADAVVVATGIVQSPKTPAVADRFPPGIVQMHSSSYRNPADLPPGAVLVVGSGQSGTSIAHELRASGRRVFLSVGSNPRIPRRYRGRDILAWTSAAGLRTLRGNRFSQHAHVSDSGPHDLALDALAARGVHLVGHVEAIDGTRLSLSTDLRERVRAADAFEAALLDAIDAWIDDEGISAPSEPRRRRAGLATEGPACLDLGEQAIKAVIWATGFGFDFSWIECGVLGADGEPLQERGVTSVPGLYVVGMNWRTRPLSAYVGSVAGEAEHVAAHAAAHADAGSTSHRA